MTTTAHLQELLNSLQSRCDDARDALLNHSLNRIRLLAQKMFRRQADLRVLAETDDVVSNAMIRLHRALESVRPETVRAFYGLAAQHIRWVLQDLIREKQNRVAVEYRADPVDRADPIGEPSDLLSWSDFHDCISKLPLADRELFDALFYQGLEQAEAADLLGIPLRTLKRRWLNARLHLVELLKGQMPGERV